MSALLSLVKNCRSIRCFDNSREISEATLRELIETVRYTPSSVNLQPLKFRLVYDREECRRVRPLTKWAGLLKGYNGPAEDEDPTAYIVILFDSTISANKDMFMPDVGIAAQTIALAACEKGIGTCMIGSFDKEKIMPALDIPDTMHPCLVCALGYPMQETVIEDVAESTAYYRDANNVHHVPKRTVDELIIC